MKWSDLWTPTPHFYRVLFLININGFGGLHMGFFGDVDA